MFFYDLKLLSPLFYRTRQDSGAAGSNTTDPWIGDLAISYSINYSLGLSRIGFDYTGTKPHYEELLKLPYVTSVAYPTRDVAHTRVYDVATSFISQGYFNSKAFLKTGNAPMRNWLKRQGLLPGNEFKFAIATRDRWIPPERFTIRLGNMKECLASCIRSKEQDKEIIINMYTLKLIWSKFRIASESFDEALVSGDTSSYGSDGQLHIEYVLPQYVLIRGVNIDKWLSLLNGYS
ncbi:MAG: hypothetical protein ACYDAZ_06525 [Thermoplasmataceae archaeon]